MDNKKDKRQKQVNDMISIARMGSFLLLGSIACKFVFDSSQSMDISSYNNVSPALIFNPLLILMMVYFIISFSYIPITKRYRNNYMFRKIELTTLFVLFSVIIFLCGANESNFKFIYLFIIISTSIEFGLNAGLKMASSASAIILLMDLFFDKYNTINRFFENDLILSGLFLLTAWFLGYYVDTEKEYKKHLEDLANIDGLTGAYNHRFFYDYLRNKKLWDNSIYNKVSMMFIDVDDFKIYNDLYGHQKGDAILKSVCEVLLKHKGETGIVSRYGGDEFAVLLPNVEESDVIKIGEKIIAETKELHINNKDILDKITISIGVSVYPDKAKNNQELIKSADDALYKAKMFHKNRIETYTSVLDDMRKNVDENEEEILGSIKTFISIINSRDKYTYGHVERVVSYSRIIAEHLNLSEEDKKLLIQGSYMHDIGKINVDKEVLMKKMKLSDDEWNQLKVHPEEGVEIIKSVKSLVPTIPIVLHHHERYDGTGYPHGLKGEDIPYLARVLTVVDSFDAMTSTRPYNVKKTFKEAYDELLKFSGIQFDPYIVEEFIKAMKEANLDTK